MIAHGMPIYVALEAVDMRFGFERLGGLVREKMHAEPRTRALFVFAGKRGHTMKILTWDGTGVILIHKRATEADAFWRPTRRRERCDVRSALQGRERDATRTASPSALTKREARRCS